MRIAYVINPPAEYAEQPRKNVGTVTGNVTEKVANVTENVTENVIEKMSHVIRHVGPDKGGHWEILSANTSS